MLELFLTYLQAHGWTLQRSPTPGFPEPLARRYPRCPEDWLALLASVRSLVREDGGAWFLCGPDYVGQTDSAFRWNEWELLSLEAAGDDAAWRAEIRSFWDAHLPIVLSVAEGYAYYALSLADGSVVQGSEPEFEDCRTAAPSFRDFMGQVLQGQIQL